MAPRRHIHTLMMVQKISEMLGFSKSSGEDGWIPPEPSQTVGGDFAGRFHVPLVGTIHGAISSIACQKTITSLSISIMSIKYNPVRPSRRFQPRITFAKRSVISDLTHDPPTIIPKSHFWFTSTSILRRSWGVGYRSVDALSLTRNTRGDITYPIIPAATSVPPSKT